MSGGKMATTTAVVVTMIAVMIMTMPIMMVHADDEPTLSEVIVWVRGNRTEVDNSISLVEGRVNAITSVISAVPQQISELQQFQVDSIEWARHNRTQVDNAISLVDGRVTALASVVGTLNPQVSELTTSVNSLSDKVTPIPQQISELQQYQVDSIEWTRRNRSDIDASITSVSDRVTTLDSSVSTLDNAFQPVKSAVESLSSDVEALDDRVGVVDDRVDATVISIDQLGNWLKNNRSDIDASVTSLDGRVSTLDNQFQPVKSAVESVVTDVESVTQSVAAVSARVDGTQTNVTIVADTLTTYKDQSQAQIIDLQTATVHLGKRIDDISGFNDSTIVAEVNTLREWSSVTNTTVHQLSSHVVATDTKVDTLSSHVTASDTKIDNLSSHITTTDTKVDDAAAKIAALQTTIREVNQTNADLRQLTASLIGQLNELKASIKTQCLTPKVSSSADRRLLADTDDICNPSAGTDGLTGGVVAVIVIGAIIGVGALGAAVVCCVRRRQRKMQPLLGEDELHSFEPSQRLLN